jgi:hypothetical protein
LSNRLPAGLKQLFGPFHPDAPDQLVYGQAEWIRIRL